jgi:hypothetical protein
MADHTIYFIGGEDDESGVLTSLQNGEECTLSLAYRGRHISASARDFFEAFCEIRLQLEPEALIPFCYGASLNVYPSGMSRDMSKGLMAYRLVSGSQATRESLVRIFEHGHDVIPSSVANQKAFFAEWLASLKA